MTTFTDVRKLAKRLFDAGGYVGTITEEFEGWWKKQTPKSNLPLKTLAEAAFRFSDNQQKLRWNCTCGEVGRGSRQFHKRVIKYSNSPVEVMKSLGAIASIVGTNGDPDNPYTRSLEKDFACWWGRMLKKNFFNKPSAMMKDISFRAYTIARRSSNKAEYSKLIDEVVMPAFHRKQDNGSWRRVA